MFKALSSKLKELAKSTDEDFRAAIKKRLEGKATEEQISALKEFIFLLPPTLNVLGDYWDDVKTPPVVKKLSSLLIAYIIRRDDLLADENLGLFGYLDDSYMVVSAFLKIQELYLRNWQDKSPEEIKLAERARKLVIAPRVIIPDESAEIDEVMELYLKGHITSFEDFLSSRKKTPRH